MHVMCLTLLTTGRQYRIWLEEFSKTMSAKEKLLSVKFLDKNTNSQIFWTKLPTAIQIPLTLQAS